MGNIAKNVHSKFDLDATRNDGALGFFQTASPPNNNNKKKISSVWGPVPGPKIGALCFGDAAIFAKFTASSVFLKFSAVYFGFYVENLKYGARDLN